MSPIERSSEFMKDLGGQALSRDLKQVRDLDISPSLVSSALSSLKVDQEAESVAVYGIKRRALAIVTHEWDIRNPKARMMNWIPEVKKSPPYDTSERNLLTAFGIFGLSDFENLGGKLMVRKPIPEAAMILLDHRWIFEGYDRQSGGSFSRLRESLWAIAMLPKSVVENALNKGHFLLINEEVEKDAEDQEGKIMAIAAITKGFDRILVEDFFEAGWAKQRYQENTLDSERETPVIVMRYY